MNRSERVQELRSIALQGRHGSSRKEGLFYLMRRMGDLALDEVQSVYPNDADMMLPENERSSPEQHYALLERLADDAQLDEAERSYLRAEYISSLFRRALQQMADFLSERINDPAEDEDKREWAQEQLQNVLREEKEHDAHAFESLDMILVAKTPDNN